MITLGYIVAFLAVIYLIAVPTSVLWQFKEIVDEFRRRQQQPELQPIPIRRDYR